MDPTSAPDNFPPQEDQNFERHVAPLMRIARGDDMRPETRRAVAREAAEALLHARMFLERVAASGGILGSQAQTLLRSSGKAF